MRRPFAYVITDADHYIGEDERINGPTRLAPADKIAHAETGNAAKDGYTVEARRLQCDLPGNLRPKAEADRIEAAESEYSGGSNYGTLNDY